MVVVHPADKGPIIPEDSFDFRRMLELEPAMDVPTVSDRPDAIDVPVDPRAISPELGTRLHEFKEERGGMLALRARPRCHRIGELPSADFLAEHEEATMEEGLI